MHQSEANAFAATDVDNGDTLLDFNPATFLTPAVSPSRPVGSLLPSKARHGTSHRQASPPFLPRSRAPDRVQQHATDSNSMEDSAATKLPSSPVVAPARSPEAHNGDQFTAAISKSPPNRRGANTPQARLPIFDSDSDEEHTVLQTTQPESSKPLNAVDHETHQHAAIEDKRQESARSRDHTPVHDVLHSADKKHSTLTGSAAVDAAGLKPRSRSSTPVHGRRGPGDITVSGRGQVCAYPNHHAQCPQVANLRHHDTIQKSLAELR